MELYIDPAATTSRAVLAFCKAARLEPSIHAISLMKGEHRQAAFAKLNPNCMVPVLVDGALVLTESAAILYHLARKSGSSLCPTDAAERARLDELTAWFGTNFYRDFGVQFVYPQVLPQHRRPSEEANRVTVEWGREQSKRWLAVLEAHWLGPNRSFLVGDRLTMVDYYGVSILSLGELVGCSLPEYPNVRRWYETIGADPSWIAVNPAFRGFVEAISARGESFVSL